MVFIDYICAPVAERVPERNIEGITVMKRLVVVLCIAAVPWVVLSSCGRNRKAGSMEAVTGRVRLGEVILADSLPVKVPVADGCGRVRIGKQPGVPVVAEFDPGICDLLYAEIGGVGEEANIRFNQIVMPGGGTDGPFGRSIEYDLVRRGTYRLVIGESLMAGEPWGGEFMLELWLGCKVPYTVGRNYFVNNSYTADRLPAATITTQGEFDAVFGKAPVMGALPTPVDFDTQYVIALIEPMTDEAVRFQVESLVKIGDKVILTYDREVGDRRSYFVRPMLMLVVDRAYWGRVEMVTR